MQQYDLAATLTSGQAFRWRETNKAWEGVVRNRWVRITQLKGGICAEAMDVKDWHWLEDYLQVHVDIDQITGSFPNDAHLNAAIRECAGLRLLKQEPWECLASFILSSTKQIVQIQQIVELICQRFGEPLRLPEGHPPAWSFPLVERLAASSERELRACKMGFRAPYLYESAKMIARREVKLEQIGLLPLEQAREQLLRLPGVGRKIADCVLLFAYGFQQAFPVDVWILKALRTLYFPRRKPGVKQLMAFTETYFGPNAGYAQQYLFHYMRTHIGRSKSK